jgi:hypothetical protein
MPDWNRGRPVVDRVPGLVVEWSEAAGPGG